MTRDIKAAICIAILLSAAYGASEAGAYIQGDEFKGKVIEMMVGAD
ncbi:MAG: hypothetical protein V3R25_10075 [Nitrosomonadaceae bacterium]